ncbi:MAG: hypothetical protein JW904_02990 [Spirochaetales bacterium]|nr:hypothetical protein [Spirochaetales bacterium]
MKNFYVFILLLAILCNAGAQTGLSVSISLYDQKIYFLHDTVQMRVSVKNISSEKIQFQIADRKVFSLDFIVSTAVNRPMMVHSEYFKSERNSSRPVLYRDISLSPGEEYSFIVNLNDFVELAAPNEYILQAEFYPELFIDEKTSIALLSDRITVNIRPGTSDMDQRSKREAEITRDMQRETLSPDAVVRFMLDARKTEHKDKFFLYINLEKLYINNYLTTDENKKQFAKLSEEQRKIRITQYKEQIWASKEEWLFMLKAHEYTIVSTFYRQFDATVVVNQVFLHPDYREPRQYTYTLSKANPTNTWEIVKYSVVNSNESGR